MIALISKSALLGGAMSIAIAGVAFAAPSAKPAAPADPAKVEKRVMIVRGDGPGRGPGRGFHRRVDPEQRAQRLRDVLQLTPAQEPALTAFLEAGKPEVRTELRERTAPDAPPPAPLTTPERLDKQLARMTERQAIFAKRVSATKAFYAQLSPTQRKAFDALHPGGGDRRVRILRSEAGEAPMVFDSEGGDFAMEDMGELMELAALGELAPLPPMPPLPPEAPMAWEAPPPPPAPPAPRY